MRLVVWTIAISLLCTPARAQVDPILIGIIAGENAAASQRGCFAGAVARSEKMLAQYRAGAAEVMSAYLAVAGANEHADVSSLYRRKLFWAIDGTVADATAVNDALARALHAAGISLGEPDQLQIGGAGETATGQWAVRDPKDADVTIGHYRVVFSKKGSRWLLNKVEVLQGGKKAIPLSPYCFTAGDVAHFRATGKTKGAAAEWFSWVKQIDPASLTP